MIATRATTRAASIAVAALCGAIFGIGLSVSRMTDPEKVKDFLDIAAIPQGGWDPSLAVVMLAAIIPAFVGLRAHRALRKPLAADTFKTQAALGIDRNLVLGSMLFGVGWGLSGLCPGPAIADLGIIPVSILPFVAAMLAGSWLFSPHGGRQAATTVAVE